MSDGYEYTVRFQEIDALGEPVGYFSYYEWSGGHVRIVDRDEAEEIAREWRDDPSCDYMSNIEVVRRPIPEVGSGR